MTALSFTADEAGRLAAMVDAVHAHRGHWLAPAATLTKTDSPPAVDEDVVDFLTTAEEAIVIMVRSLSAPRTASLSGYASDRFTIARLGGRMPALLMSPLAGIEELVTALALLIGGPEAEPELSTIDASIAAVLMDLFEGQEEVDREQALGSLRAISAQPCELLASLEQEGLTACVGKTVSVGRRFASDPALRSLLGDELIDVLRVVPGTGGRTHCLSHMRFLGGPGAFAAVRYEDERTITLARIVPDELQLLLVHELTNLPGPETRPARALADLDASSVDGLESAATIAYVEGELWDEAIDPVPPLLQTLRAPHLVISVHVSAPGAQLRCGASIGEASACWRTEGEVTIVTPTPVHRLGEALEAMVADIDEAQGRRVIARASWMEQTVIHVDETDAAVGVWADGLVDHLLAGIGA